MLTYLPSLPVNPGKLETSNPYPTQHPQFPEINGNWRTRAAVPRGTNEVFFGSTLAYGKLGGIIASFRTDTRQVTSTRIFPNEHQSVSALAVWGALLVGGSSVEGNVATPKKDEIAKVFIWDPVKAQDPAQNPILFEIAPIPGSKDINSLLSLGENKFVGLAGVTNGAYQLFVFDAESRSITFTHPLPGVVDVGNYSSLQRASNGIVYGLYANGIFKFDPVRMTVENEATYPGGRITGGFAVIGRTIFFAAGPRIIQYTAK